MVETLIKAKSLQAGDIAPDFEAQDQNGHKVSLNQFKGKTIILFFYPKDSTPGCTKEACSFRDRFLTFKKKNIIILGVSRDSLKSHQNFAEKYDLPFTLISDMDKKVQIAYVVWRQKILYGRKITETVRSTFIIAPDQKIAHIFDVVDCENHAEEVLEKLEELRLI